VLFIFSREIDLQPPCELAPSQQHPVAAALALKTDVRAETYNSPLEGTARMRFTQPEHIVQLEVYQHMLRLGFAIPTIKTRFCALTRLYLTAADALLRAICDKL
jgi:hypothetical protein